MLKARPLWWRQWRWRRYVARHAQPARLDLLRRAVADEGRYLAGQWRQGAPRPLGRAFRITVWACLICVSLVLLVLAIRFGADLAWGWWQDMIADGGVVGGAG